MDGRDFAQLSALCSVAKRRSFARAAEELNSSRPAVSRSIAALEDRLGVRLLNRTTRSVALTEAGARLVEQVGPALEVMQTALSAARAMPGAVQGQLRINASSMAAREWIAPILPVFLARYPDVSVEVASEDRLVDVVAGGFDAGIRLGEVLERDMVALPIGPEQRMRIVAAPSYLQSVGAPGHPRDLGYHRCLNLRAPTSGLPYRWELSNAGKRLEVEVSGPLIADEPAVLVSAVLAGRGLAYLFEADVIAHLASGALIALLSEWTPPFPGFHIYFPSRRGVSPALRAFLDHVKAENIRTTEMYTAVQSSDLEGDR